jgi:hypothetical protein
MVKRRARAVGVVIAFVGALVTACGSRAVPAKPEPPRVDDGPTATEDDGADDEAPPATDPEVDKGDDRDGDGVPDGIDLCPDQAMVMSAGCTPEQQRGCPDDCRPPRF